MDPSLNTAPVITGLVKVLFVRVCVPVSVTMPAAMSLVKAIVPVLVGRVSVAAPFVILEITGVVKVLFVSVSDPVSETTSASEIAVFNSASVALTVFDPRLIDLFENVFVDDAVTVISVVSATVPVASGKVIVRSAVGFPAESVSS